MIKTIKFNSITNDEQRHIVIEKIKEIFYLSSSLKEFSSPERKAAFFKRWCGDYLTLYPEEFLIMMEDEIILGYLCGCIDSLQSLNVLEVPGLTAFSEQFWLYPAHLHINFHPDCRGRGLGSVLIKEFCEDLKIRKIPGVHLVTSPEAANIPFYHRLGFALEIEQKFNQMTLLFMGKKLD